jgi:hypothetical protein
MLILFQAFKGIEKVKNDVFIANNKCLHVRLSIQFHPCLIIFKTYHYSFIISLIMMLVVSFLPYFNDCIANAGPGSAMLGNRLESRPISASPSFSSSLVAYKGTAKTFNLVEMERATLGFDESRIIGEGGFGRVYEGILEDGERVAIKVLKRDDQQGTREFLAEVEMLSRLHHRNLVKLIGICTEGHSRCLVYELVPNGSVESHLHGKIPSPIDKKGQIIFL